MRTQTWKWDSLCDQLMLLITFQFIYLSSDLDDIDVLYLFVGFNKYGLKYPVKNMNEHIWRMMSPFNIELQCFAI